MVYYVTVGCHPRLGYNRPYRTHDSGYSNALTGLNMNNYRVYNQEVKWIGEFYFGYCLWNVFPPFHKESNHLL